MMKLRAARSGWCVVDELPSSTILSGAIFVLEVAKAAVLFMNTWIETELCL
jgi:hypothetical protein